MLGLHFPINIITAFHTRKTMQRRPIVCSHLNKPATEKLCNKLPRDLRQEAMPKHVALIADGNKRWAEDKGMPTQYGHHKGSERLNELISSSCALGIQVFSVYAFSSENWSRPKEEVDFIMKAMEVVILPHVTDLANKSDLRFSMIGDKSRLPTSIRHAISSVEDSSKMNKGTHFVMAISYSGRREIIEAVKKIVEEVRDGKLLRGDDVSTEVFERHLETNMFPEPDLLIRTSGELRISNFMLWQLAYSELYFSDKLFPDFDGDDLVEALRSFQKRKRRFGGRKIE